MVLEKEVKKDKVVLNAVLGGSVEVQPEVIDDHIIDADVIETAIIEAESAPESVKSGEIVCVQESSKIEDRRGKVWNLHTRGISITNMVAILKVHRNTISNDLKVLRRRQGEAVSQLDAAASVGESLKYYDTIIQLSLKEYYAAGDLRGKNGFLQTAMAAIRNRDKLLSTTGLIPSVVGGGVNVQVNVANFTEKVANETQKMSIDELKRRRSELLNRIDSENTAK